MVNAKKKNKCELSSVKALRWKLMANSRDRGRRHEEPARDYADCGMETPRLFALLLIVLEWTRPGLPSPLRPICDLRVLDHFIKHARDAEAAMRVCKEECNTGVPLTVPLTRVDFVVWEKKNLEEQAREVQTGLWLLNMAISSLSSSISNSALHSHIDASIRNIASIRQVLRSLSIQDYVPTAGSIDVQDTWRVSSATELFQVHVNFLRGKVRLLLANAPVCQHNTS